MKNTDPLMGAKLKSKTLSTFFDFLSRFLRVWLQKVLKRQKKMLGEKIKTDNKKRRILKLLALFVNFDCKCAGNSSKNGKYLFMKVF
jgi:hypothetical protein